MPSFNRRIFDYGLYGLKNEATTVYLTIGTPSTYSQLLNTPANSGLRIGKYIAGAGNVFGNPYDASLYDRDGRVGIDREERQPDEQRQGEGF